MSRLTGAIGRYLHPRQGQTDLCRHDISLARLKEIGFKPRVIYDVGAHRGNWSREASRIYTSAEFILFEANSDQTAYLQEMGFRYFISALGPDDLPCKPFYLQKEGASMGASFYVENTPFYRDQNLLVGSIPAYRLDTLVRENALPLPDLIKLDVQGAEIDVLSGATNCLDHCGALITECSLVTYNQGAPLFADVVSWVTSHGFFCIDVCEIHRWKYDCIFQMDLLFVREPMFAKFCAVGF